MLRVSFVLCLEGTCSRVPPLTGTSVLHMQMVQTETASLFVCNSPAAEETLGCLDNYYSDRGGPNTFYRSVIGQGTLLTTILYCSYNFLVQNSKKIEGWVFW